ncbi:MAG: hypothetical protein J3K34DRAFT_423845 [Monoraphidium minutum]|nr:MAG: hypothetical protein J3K34DRAFT_423845 [Monoraphidium minutum]
MRPRMRPRMLHAAPHAAGVSGGSTACGSSVGTSGSRSSVCHDPRLRTSRAWQPPAGLACRPPRAARRPDPRRRRCDATSVASVSFFASIGMFPSFVLPDSTLHILRAPLVARVASFRVTPRLRPGRSNRNARQCPPPPPAMQPMPPRRGPPCRPPEAPGATCSARARTAAGPPARRRARYRGAPRARRGLPRASARARLRR